MQPAASIPPDTSLKWVSATASRDASVDRENNNLGLTSDAHLFYQDAIALIAFDEMPKLPVGAKIVHAQITVRAWSDGVAANHVSLDLFRTGADWKEGTGNWYYFDGGQHNNYARVYANFPAYVPPAGSTNPSLQSGITWSTSTALRQGLTYVTTATAEIPSPTADGKYPLLANTGAITFDVTSLLAKLGDLSKPLSLGLMQSIPSRGTNAGGTWFYSRNHVQPEIYAPTLTLTYR